MNSVRLSSRDDDQRSEKLGVASAAQSELLSMLDAWDEIVLVSRTKYLPQRFTTWQSGLANEEG